MADEIKSGGNSSHVSSNLLQKRVLFSSVCLADILSVFVKIIEKGIPLLPNLLMKSISMVCGERRESISTKTSCKLGRLVKYSSIMELHFSRVDLAILAYP